VTDFCHRDYFRRFRLNVEQYGEILVAHAFRALKLGDEQIGFDVRVPRAEFVRTLRAAGIDAEQLIDCGEASEVRIEVKSKLSNTRSGPAEVVHCGETKLDGVARKNCTYSGMTYLAIVLVHPGSRASGDPKEEGVIVEAWLLPSSMVKAMRDATHRPSKSLSIREIREACADKQPVFSIRDLLRAAAAEPLLDLIREVSS
jgi:hypothetical protein